MKENKIAGASALKILGLAVSVVPTVLAILMYFPIWRCMGAEKLLSGIAVLLLVIAHAPILKYVKSILSPTSSYTVWLAIFIVFFLVSSIAEEMKVISFVGFVSNVIGALIIRLSERMCREDE